MKKGLEPSWLYDLLKPHVGEVIVCDPRKNALLRGGSKNDKVDARKLSELLRAGLVTPVYHGEQGCRTLKEFARSYLTITKDLTRVMNRKGVYRSWGIACTGRTVYAPALRKEYLEKLPETGVRRRTDRLYAQLDHLKPLRQEARKELFTESRKHPACALLRRYRCEKRIKI